MECALGKLVVEEAALKDSLAYGLKKGAEWSEAQERLKAVRAERLKLIQKLRVGGPFA